MTTLECKRSKLPNMCGDCKYNDKATGNCQATYEQLKEINKKRTYFYLGSDKKLHKTTDQTMIDLMDAHDWDLAERILFIQTQMVFIYEEEE